MGNIALFALAVVIAVALSLLFVNRRRLKRPSTARRDGLPLRSGRVRRLHLSLDGGLFALALVTFLATRLIGLERFPVYFFTDEAIGTVQAANLIDHGWRGSDGELLPTYFENDHSYSISTSVYAQVLPYVLFGQSVLATRATAAFIALTGAIAAALLLKNILRLRFWWSVVLILAVTPAWFLHSRTAFEHVLWVSFLAWFLYFYLQYRTARPRRIFAALLAGALSFYSYNGGQLGVGVLAVALLLIDARYHWRMARQSPRLMSAALLWALVLALPYARFQTQHSAEIAAHLRLLDSYLVSAIPWPDKVGRFVAEYVKGLNPAYWYQPDYAYDLIRHRLKGYGHLPWIMLPLLLVGLGGCVKNYRQAGYRAILLTLLIAPLGGALAAVSIQRDLVMVLPASLLTAIGLEMILERLLTWLPYRGLAVGVGVALTIGSMGLLVDAVRNGPTWFDDYGLYGLQFGAREVFEETRAFLEEQPGARVNLFPENWFNGPGALLQFFIEPGQPVVFYTFDDFTRRRYHLTSDDVFVVNPTEYAVLTADPKFTSIKIDRLIPRPDGRPGFYFVRLAYAPQFDELLAAERAVRAQPVTEEVTVRDQILSVQHTPFDLGSVTALFDHDPDTLARTASLNPAFITITLPAAQAISRVAVQWDVADGEFDLQLLDEAGQVLAAETRVGHNLPSLPTLEIALPHPIATVHALRLRLTDLNPDSDGYLHIREIAWQ